MDFNGMTHSRLHFDSINETSSRDSSLTPSEPELSRTGIKGSNNPVKKLEKRRESSRYAARDRRGKEADIFTDLKDVVPIVEESTVTHVDRIALLRVASTMCRMRRNAGKFLETDLPREDFNVNVFSEQTLTESLDGFVLLVDADGTILYVSESVSLFLGLTQTDLVGRFLNEFVHQDDYDEMIRWSTTDCDVEEASTLDDFGRYLVVRMKSVISPRGRTLNLKSAIFKSMLCRFRALTTEYGRISLLYGASTPAGQGNTLLLSNSAVKGAETTSGVYMTRHTCDMKFSYVSDGMNFLLRHDSRSLMGTSFYDLIHPSDLPMVIQSFGELFKKSHCRTPFYRLLGSNSSVAWTQTEATTINHTARGQKGQYVLCVHTIIGMQSEAESWSEPVVEPSSAAHPAFCASRVKQEIVDMAEYMGRQPEFIECVDFTPLIDPITDVNLNDFNPSRLPGGRGRRQFTDSNENMPSAKQKRKKSFDDVLDWLVRDEAGSPPPPFNGSNGEGMFLDSQPDNNLATFNLSTNEFDNQSFRGPTAQRRDFISSTTTAVGQARPSAGFSAVPNLFESLAGGQQNQKWEYDGNSIARNVHPSTATPLAGRATVARRASAALQQPSPPFDDLGLANQFEQQPQQLDLVAEERGVAFAGGGNDGQHFSRYDIHRQQQQQRHSGTAFGGARAPATRTVSALPTTNSNPVPAPNFFSPNCTINNGTGTANATMYSTMRPSNTSFPIQQRPRGSSANADDSSAGGGVQCVGEFYRYSVGSNRSRSSSSTASTQSYGASAARRYGTPQASPSPRPRRNVSRHSREPREQRPVNVNQLNAVPISSHPPHHQQQHTQPNYHQNTNLNFSNQPPSSPLNGPNFYYSARNTSNMSYYNQHAPLRRNHSADRRAGAYDPNGSLSGNNLYAVVPAKRMAYGNIAPTTECQQKDKNFYCSDLSRLAPFVPDEEMVQLEDLDLQGMFPDNMDLSEFLASETPCNPPPIVQQKQKTPYSDLRKDSMFPQDGQMNQYVSPPMEAAQQVLTQDWGFDRF